MTVSDQYSIWRSLVYPYLLVCLPRILPLFTPNRSFEIGPDLARLQFDGKNTQMASPFKIPLLIFALLVMGVMNLFFLRSEPRPESQLPSLSVSASNMFRAFCEDEWAARRLFFDKVLEVNGTLRAVDRAEDGGYFLTLDAQGSLGRMVCKLGEGERPSLNELRIGSPITVKGICRDYAFEINMDHTQVISQP